MTGKQMAYHIAKAEILTNPNGTHPTADEIWNTTPMNQLYMMQTWYEEACKRLGYEYGEDKKSS